MVVPACLVHPGGMRQGLGVLHKHKGLVLFNQGKIKLWCSTKNDLERVCVCVQTVFSFWLIRKKSIFLKSARLLVKNVCKLRSAISVLLACRRGEGRRPSTCRALSPPSVRCS